MNLLSFLLSLLFSFLSPSTTTSVSFEDQNKTAKLQDNGGKTGGFNDGEFIIVNDTNP
jgi:hypothetical protein